MKIKNIELEWYALRWDINNEKLVDYNVLYGLKEDIVKKVRKKEIYDKATLKDYLKLELMYHYWCKCEHEVAIGGLFSKYPDDFKKIDVYRQLEPNLDRIVDYINNEMKLGFEI